MRSCKQCIRYGYCDSLCSEAEAYVDQDHVSRDHHHVSLDIYEISAENILLADLPNNRKYRNNMSPDQEVMVTLRIEGFTLREIANIMGRSIASIKMMHWRAKGKSYLLGIVRKTVILRKKQ